VIEASVAGPDGANRLFTVTGQFDINFNVFSQTASQTQQNETFKVLVGPVLTRQQFFRAIGTASMAKTSFVQQAPASNFGWSITGIDADFDDESGQVELRVEVSVIASGVNNRATIVGLAFQVTILGAVAA
jgi:hypothetical protein